MEEHREEPQTKFIIETTDPEEAKRLVKANDMAFFIWELYHNYWRKYKHDESNFNIMQFKEDLQEMLDENNIIIDDLTN